MRAFTTVGVRTLRTTSKNNQENQENLTTNNTTTPTRRPTTRTPLQPRDQNAMRVPPKGSQPLAVKSGTNMPLDKQNASRRPLMPKLGANPKQGSKSPLTPRVAGSTTPAATTPAARRAARVERPENGTTTTHKEDLSVPGSYLSNNVTPRSGPRKVRVDSPNNTPTTGHPQSTADLPRIAQDLTYGQGLGINGMERDGSKRANVSFSPTVSDIGYTSPPATADSKFFFASDVKSGAPPQAPRPTLQKSSSFFYANGDSIPPPLKSGGSTVGSSIGEESCQPKFFHANGTPDLHASPQFGPPRSTVSNSSRITSPRLAPTAPIISHRPASPQKLGSHASVTSLKSAPGRTSPALSRPGPGGRGQSAQGTVASRRTSLESSQRLGHGRTGSLGSMVEAKTPPVRKVSYGSPEPQGPLTPALALSPISISTPEGRLEEEDEEPEDDDEVKDEVASEPSPIKAGHSIERMNELAAEARRERKVLDLEITNSSLEAINRTLERQMRKQTAELRRYRRLSRSGRLSINTAGSSRISSINLSAMDGVEGPDLSDMSEEDGEDGEEDGEDEEIFSSEEDTPDDGSLSPGAMAESDARHRTRDEKRLQLDLSKHQQLLVDSQKMNQSLKRCLGWTEELINEGKKALEYHVRVSDVDLPKSLADNFGHGGRVLAPDEVSFNQAEEDEENERIMSGLHSPLLREVMNLAPWGGLGRDDRDSGIELDPERGMPQEPLQREPQ